MNINKYGKWEYKGGFNPIGVSIADGYTVAPHGSIVRKTYTTPVGRAAFVYGLFAAVIATVAPTLSLSKKVTFNVTIKGQEPRIVFEYISGTSVVGAGNDSSLATEIMLQSGDTIEITTLDQSVGGTNTFSFAALINEFDL